MTLLRIISMPIDIDTSFVSKRIDPEIGMIFGFSVFYGNTDESSLIDLISLVQ